MASSGFYMDDLAIQVVMTVLLLINIPTQPFWTGNTYLKIALRQSCPSFGRHRGGAKPTASANSRLQRLRVVPTTPSTRS
jgi:hypothetical protein